jgi:hypothetical protein
MHCATHMYAGLEYSSQSIKSRTAVGKNITAFIIPTVLHHCCDVMIKTEQSTRASDEYAHLACRRGISQHIYLISNQLRNIDNDICTRSPVSVMSSYELGAHSSKMC